MGIELTVQAHNIGKQKYAELSWAGTQASVKVYRDGSVIATTATGTTSYSDKLAAKVRTATYKVCQSGANTCSEPVTVTW